MAHPDGLLDGETFEQHGAATAAGELGAPVLAAAGPDDRQHGAEQREAVHVPVDGGLEDEQLGPEAGDERDAAERQQEHQHAQRQHRRALREPAVAASSHRCPRPRHRLDDEERAHVPEQIRHQIEQHHPDAVADSAATPISM